MVVSNAASALGQKVGKLFESELVNNLRHLVEESGYSIRPEKLKNGTENTYQIDAVIRDEQGEPIILLDPKYIRYKKHNRDKGSWLCTAHYNLRKTYPTIRKTIAVLAGNWSTASISLIQSFGVEVITLPFAHMVSVLDKYDIAFDWNEKDRETPRQSLFAFDNLSATDRIALTKDLVSPISDQLQESVKNVIETDREDTHRRISSVEVLLKTDQNEMLLLQYGTVVDAVKEMTSFMSDRDDVQRSFRMSRPTNQNLE